MSEEQKYLIASDNFGIEKEKCADCETGLYTFYLWGKGMALWYHREEMYEFMELMTDETTQALFRKEMLIIIAEEKLAEELA